MAQAKSAAKSRHAAPVPNLTAQHLVVLQTIARAKLHPFMVVSIVNGDPDHSSLFPNGTTEVYKTFSDLVELGMIRQNKDRKCKLTSEGRRALKAARNKLLQPDLPTSTTAWLTLEELLNVLVVGLAKRGSLGMTPRVATALLFFEADIEMPKEKAKALLRRIVSDKRAAKYGRTYYDPEYLPE